MRDIGFKRSSSMALCATLLVALAIAGCKSSSDNKSDAGDGGNSTSNGGNNGGSGKGGGSGANGGSGNGAGNGAGGSGGTAADSGTNNDDDGSVANNDVDASTDAGTDAGQDSGPVMYTLTVNNYISWCTVMVNGVDKGTAATSATMFAKDTVVTLVGDKVGSFFWGYWTNTVGDTTSAHDTDKTTTIKMTGDKTVLACCPTTNGGTCP